MSLQTREEEADQGTKSNTPSRCKSTGIAPSLSPGWVGTRAILKPSASLPSISDGKLSGHGSLFVVGRSTHPARFLALNPMAACGAGLRAST